MLEITVGPVDRGASIEVFSQYPGEREVLWVPLSLLAPDGPPRLEATGQGVVSLVAVRVNANLMASTLEEMLERKKRGHLASFRFLLSDLGRALRGIAADERAEERLARDSLRVDGEVTHTVEGLVQRALGLVEAVLAAHEKTPAERFNDDAEYKSLVTEMLDAGTMAGSVLRLYLEDQSRPICNVLEMTLQDAHRALVAFRTRAMAALQEGEARRAAALGLCQLKGLVVESVHETNEMGETRILWGAAEGITRRDLGLLLDARADPNARHRPSHARA